MIIKNHTIQLLSKIACISTAIFIAAASCTTVKEYPEEGKEIDPTMSDVTIRLSTDPTITTGSVLSKSPDTHNWVYFVVELYENDYTGTPLYRFEKGAELDNNNVASIALNLKLNAGNYKLAAFASYAQDSTGTGNPYKTDDLTSIIIADLDNYTGSSDLRECYALRMDVTLSHSTWYSEQTFDGTLTAPVGRLEIISEDAQDFASKVFGSLSTPIDITNDDFWKDYSVTWSYEPFCPVGYNALTDEANWAEDNIGFTSTLTPLSNEEVLMGYDYVIVNGDETTVKITIQVVENATGNVISTYSGLEAKILKGQTTVIRGKYLTTGSNSGVGINPDFEGEDIEITI